MFVNIFFSHYRY